jgi:(1->4)-alpha-D-glucan 1-alpha-D-glucosylmutase
MSASELLRRPVSTYRLQLSHEFGFARARDIVPYLARLGVTDCYTSPDLKANPGSPHGYDICDHSQLNPELGLEADASAFAEALVAHDLGHIVDFVPNHMACDPTANSWWRDVLENGPSSPYAHFFDIDWDPVKPELHGKVLLPVLGDQYGVVLERGDLQLQFDAGTLTLVSGARSLPINPRQAPRVLGADADRLARQVADDSARREYLSILTALDNLPPYTERDPARIAERQREKEVARERLARLVEASPAVRTVVEASVRRANGVPGNAASFDDLHALLEAQAYRLAYWRTASDEINYRRFFDVNELVALRMEDPAVFDAVHGLLARRIAQGAITGIRVDHPDGLFDPQRYLERLQALVRAALRERTAAGAADRTLYLVVEKILSPGESLAADWPVSGTTGYAFLNLVTGLFIDGRLTPRLRRIYAQVTGRQATFDEIAYESKCTIMDSSMAAELNVLAHALNRISEGDRRRRDFTLQSCRKALREVVACFPLYRTYVSDRGVSAFDREAVGAAIAEARRRNPLMEGSIFEFLEELLLPAGADHADPAAADRARFAMHVQQFTAPVQAKGVEDTAFYRYHVLVAANDVGGHPGRLGVSPVAFHEANRRRLADWPLEMLATSTHDTKRGEDARARLAVISELPDPWRHAVSRWMRTNARHRTRVDGAWAPDRNDEYLFYQALLGVWPAEPPSPLPQHAPADLVPRLSAYMQKAVREAKVHTSWIEENPAYGRAVARFVQHTLTGATSVRFLASLLPFARRLARAGALNSLAQLVLKLASPGVPDFYQGTELWDLSLVDPDNRRPVDFAQRANLLDALVPLLEAAEAGQVVAGDVSALLDRWEDGRIKLYVTAAGLRFRRRHADLMLRGAYIPLEPAGPAADHLVGLARSDRSGTLLAIVPRLAAALIDGERPEPRASTWNATRLLLPERARATRYRHVLTGEPVEAHATNGERWLDPADLFRTCPVALLWAGPPTTDAGLQLI